VNLGEVPPFTAIPCCGGMVVKMAAVLECLRGGEGSGQVAHNNEVALLLN